MQKHRPHWFAQGVFMIGLAFAACVQVIDEYRSLQGMGYTVEHRAELQNKINGLVPLSVADLGYDAN